LSPGDLLGVFETEPSPYPKSSTHYLIYRPVFFSVMEELIRTIPKFSGAANEDIVKWLKDIEAVFDKVQLGPSNKYVAAQYYLTNTAAKWFRYNKSRILDWSTFQCEISKAFQPYFNLTLSKMTKQQPSSFFSSHLHNQQHSTFDEKLHQMKQERDVSHVSVLTSSNISSTSTICNKELDNENHQSDLVNNNSLTSFEDLEVKDLKDKCLCEHEHDPHSPMLVTINELDLTIGPQYPDVADNYDELKQQDANVATDCDKSKEQGESVINSCFVKPDVEDVFVTIAGNAQYLWFDKYQPRQPRIFNKVYTGNDWNQYIKKYYDTDIQTPYEDSAFKIFWFYLRKWKYRRKTVFLFLLLFSFTKRFYLMFFQFLLLMMLI
jgi:hypothetical protein